MKNWKYFIVSSAVSLLVIFSLQQSSFWRQINQSSYDIISILDPPQLDETNILIVSIDEASFNDIQLFWPWPREMHGRLLNRLKRAGAKVVAFDLIFSEPSAFGDLDDLNLAEAIQQGPPVVLGSFLSRQMLAEGLQITSTEPLDIYQDAGARSGSVNVYQDNDGVLRRTPLDDRTFWKSIFELSQEQQVTAGDYSNKLVRYVGDVNTIPSVSYYRALDESLLPDDVFRDKIILVGLDILSAAELGVIQDDRYFSPFSLDSSASMSGVEHHANMLINRQNDLFVSPVSELEYLLLLSGLVLVASWLFDDWRLKKGLAILGLLTGSVIMLYWYSFHFQQSFFPLFSMLLAVFLPFMGQGTLAYQNEFRQRLFITKAFSKYVSKDVLSELLAAPEKLTFGGEVKQVTILFTDLRDFTTISETMPVEQIAALLNEHLTRMSRIVLQHCGTLDKYIGDAVMAFWGAPIADEQQADHALAAAIAMQQECEKMRSELAAKDLPQVHMRVGIHSGKAVVGNLGSELLFDYTCLGDTVNLASRLEGVNKFYLTEILISEDTRNGLTLPFNLQLTDKIVVKGKTKPIAIYTITENNCSEATDVAFELYARKKWEQAQAAFSVVLKLDPDNKTAQVFLKRIQRFREVDPGEHWTGLTVLEQK
ncbi:MAG: adenylate/guanylate cyclase domain-containing protein [Pseudohongiellaceae bacterium]